VDFEASNFTQVPLQPSCVHSWLKPHPLSNKLASHRSWPMVALTERQNSLTARNGGPTWPEDSFL